ncbi:MAG: S1/P1 Nuclease, partial [Vulcanimicrobiaceae bacterium]
ANLRSVRETLTTRDLGILGLFVGSGSSPLHVTMHSDGWDKYPNSKGIFAKFERYPSSGIKEAQIKNRLKAYTPCNCTLEEETVKYLADAASQVERLYQLSAFGAFDAPTNAGTGFAVDRLATGATELRNLIAAAWLESQDESVGTPPVKVSDVEKGAATLTKASLGDE